MPSLPHVPFQHVAPGYLASDVVFGVVCLRNVFDSSRPLVWRIVAGALIVAAFVTGYAILLDWAFSEGHG